LVGKLNRVSDGIFLAHYRMDGSFGRVAGAAGSGATNSVLYVLSWKGIIKRYVPKVLKTVGAYYEGGWLEKRRVWQACRENGDSENTK